MTETSGHQAPPAAETPAGETPPMGQMTRAIEAPRAAPIAADETPVGDYPERPFAEASEGVPNFDPSRLDHQEMRLAQGTDYVEDTRAVYPGYDPPQYGDAEA